MVVLAAVDIGNTKIRIGLFKGKRLLRQLRVPNDIAGEANRILRKADTVAVCSVNPGVLKKLRHPRILQMGRDFPPGIRNTVDRPKEVGMDRLANATAAASLTKGACIVVDVGTAVTIDLVDGLGRFAGGLIAPGLEMGAWALSRRAAALPKVEPKIPKRIIGKRTITCIQSGLHWSVGGLIESGIKEIRSHRAGRVPAYGTGGDGTRYRKLFTRFIPTLTLMGIRISHERHFSPDHGPGEGRHRRRRGRR